MNKRQAKLRDAVKAGSMHLGDLPPRQRTILERGAMGEPRKLTALLIDLTEERVRQLEVQAVRHLGRLAMNHPEAFYYQERYGSDVRLPPNPPAQLARPAWGCGICGGFRSDQAAPDVHERVIRWLDGR
jgi:hypothetical protein